MSIRWIQENQNGNQHVTCCRQNSHMLWKLMASWQLLGLVPGGWGYTVLPSESLRVGHVWYHCREQGQTLSTVFQIVFSRAWLEVASGKGTRGGRLISQFRNPPGPAAMTCQPMSRGKHQASALHVHMSGKPCWDTALTVTTTLGIFKLLEVVSLQEGDGRCHS